MLGRKVGAARDESKDYSSVLGRNNWKSRFLFGLAPSFFSSVGELELESALLLPDPEVFE